MVLRYWGGKASLWRWIVDQLPNSDRYYEPFCGGAHIFQNKWRSGFEQISDLNPRTVNFWKTLQSDPAAIVAALSAIDLDKIMQTYPGCTIKRRKSKKVAKTPKLSAPNLILPWCEHLFELDFIPIDGEATGLVLQDLAYETFATWHAGHEDPAIDAAYYYLQGMFGFLGLGVSRNVNPAPSRANSRPDIMALHRAHRRLQGVSIKQQCAIEVISSAPAEGTLIYADPPYEMKSRRTTSSRPTKKGETPYRAYFYDADAEMQRAIVEALKNFSDRGGMVVLSNYPNPIYDELIGDWRSAEIEIRHYNTKDDQDEPSPIEKLWFCPNVKHVKNSLSDLVAAS